MRHTAQNAVSSSLLLSYKYNLVTLSEQLITHIRWLCYRFPNSRFFLSQHNIWRTYIQGLPNGKVSNLNQFGPWRVMLRCRWP